MRMVLAAALAALALPTAALADFGDTQYAYQDGVVYDDDLVPGRGPDAPFLTGERASGVIPGGYYVDQGYSDPSRRPGPRPQPSRNLIGPDGRVIR